MATVKVIPPRTKRPERLCVAAYCRVSSDSADQLHSYATQIRSYTEYISQQDGWELVDIYADEGLTGTRIEQRTEFQRMMADCRRGKIDRILVKSISRFSRNTKDCLTALRELAKLGVTVKFEKENINTLTESSEFLITLFSGFAQAESESLSKNVSWGIRKGMESGKVHFQNVMGYRKGPDGQPEIVPEEAKIVRKIYQRYLDGCSLPQIKQELEAEHILTTHGLLRWSHQGIRNILRNEKYIGDALLQKTYITDCISKRVKQNRGELPMYYVENNHPAIIPREIFAQVQEEIKRRSSKRKVMQKHGKTERGKYSGKYALTELLVCGECGTPYKRVTWAKKGKKRIVWRCVSRLEFGTRYCHHSPTLDEGKLHAAILSAMNELAAVQEEVCPTVLSIAEKVRQPRSADGRSLSDWQERLTEVTQKQTKLLDLLLENMDDPELNAKMKALTEEKQALKQKLKEAKQKESDLREQETQRQQMWSCIQEHAQGYTEFDDELVRQVIEKITVVDGETIRVKFRGESEVREGKIKI